jgi:hypothetical protein
MSINGENIDPKANREGMKASVGHHIQYGKLPFKPIHA